MYNFGRIKPAVHHQAPDGTSICSMHAFKHKDETGDRQCSIPFESRLYSFPNVAVTNAPSSTASASSTELVGDSIPKCRHLGMSSVQQADKGL